MKDKFGMKEQKVPEFSLPNSRGETTNIRTFEQKKNVLIALLRKAT
jgi:peroxiredoxin